MKNQKKIVFTVLALVLLSGTFLSFAAAQDAPPDPTAIPDPAHDNTNDNGNVTQDGEQLYTIQDNRTIVPNDISAPQENNPNLIATQTSPDNTLPIAVAAIALAIVIGAVGTVYYRKKSMTKKQ